MADDKIIDVSVGKLFDCPTNPRKYFNEAKLLQLQQSMATQGLRQPITVRPHPAVTGGFEIVLGHRRSEAARRLEWPTIRAILRVMDDHDVLEAQLAENRDREDLHALEEAHAYQRLHEDFGEPIEVIAEKYGMSPSTVARRLALIDLVEPVQKAFMENEFSTGIAELIARIPGPFQAEAVEQVKWQSIGDAKRVIEGRFMLQLATAPFPITDASLIAKAGTCTDCPKRTGNDRNLFGDIEGPDVCTDPACYNRKVDVWWERTAASAEANGVRVMQDAEAKKVIQYGHVVTKSGYVAIGDRCFDDPKERTYEQLLGDRAPVVLARDGSKVHRMLKREELADALRAAGHDFTKAIAKRERSEKHVDDHAKRDRDRARLRRTVTNQSIASVVQHAELETNPATVLKMWRTTLRHLVGSSWHDVTGEVVKRRELQMGKRERPEEALQRAIAEMDLPQLRGLVVELVATKFAYTGGSDALDEYMALFGVDSGAIEQVARQMAEARA